jgi:hypothetical protein
LFDHHILFLVFFLFISLGNGSFWSVLFPSSQNKWKTLSVWTYLVWSVVVNRLSHNDNSLCWQTSQSVAPDF